MPYDIGDAATVSAAFSVDEVPTDPTTVTVKILDPGGITTTYVYDTDAEVIKDSAGNYHMVVSFNQSGFWYHRWEGTGACEAAGEASLNVQKSKF